MRYQYEAIHFLLHSVVLVSFYRAQGCCLFHCRKLWQVQLPHLWGLCKSNLYQNNSPFSFDHIISLHILKASIVHIFYAVGFWLSDHPTEFPEAFGNIPSINALSVNICTLKGSSYGQEDVFQLNQSYFRSMEIDMLPSAVFEQFPQCPGFITFICFL